ncbi:MAG: flagellar hook protein FlgE [Myxococcales bacterium]|nr:flagellar hook protein FlgE [Myxococcales bacterium]
MSIFTSLWIGTSGLEAHGDALSVVGDNIANASTFGHRASRAGFAEVLGGTAPQGQRLGAGVRFEGTQTLFGQGALVQTGVDLDMAVRGDGFFVVKGNHGGVDASYYTRDGRFRLDQDGYIVNPSGLRLQGYPIDPTGQVAAAVGDLQLAGQSAPVATTIANLAVNLDATSTTPPPWDPADPTGTSNYATSTTIYDSLGNAHRADVYFRSSGGGAWEWHALVDGGELTGGTPGTPTEIASGNLTFTASGALDTEATVASSADFIGATPGQAITFDFGDAITTDGGTGLAGSTQYASASNVLALSQDGYGAGALVDLSIADDGTITGVYSNGQTRGVAQVALALFTSDEGLRRAGDQLFAETSTSGAALVAGAASGGRGAVSGGALERSNVDLGTELVNMIAYQRAFSANAKTVTTADEMLAEVTNLKR